MSNERSNLAAGVIITCCLLLSLLAPASGISQTENSKATIYVYRHKELATRNMQPSVYVDGGEVARIDDGKFFIVKLEPGKHTVMVNKGHSGAEIDMKAGEEYYFRVVIRTGTWRGHGQIDFVQKEQGAFEIKKMEPLDAKWIKDRTRVSVDENKSRL
jgi:hypothetical protein